MILSGRDSNDGNGDAGGRGAGGSGGAVSPMVLAEGLRDVAAQAGVVAPDLVEGRTRQVFVGLPMDELAGRLADILGRKDGSEGLFLYGDDVVMVERETGEVRVMRPVVFRTWIVEERGVVPVKKWNEETGQITKAGFSKDQADVVLSSGILRKRLPVLTEVRMVRLPVAVGEVLRLLPMGYDEATGIYTAGTLDYLKEGEMEVGEAVDYFYELFRWFGWRQVERDFAIHLAALVTMYGRGLYEGKAPMFVYNANIQESGKSTCSAYVTWLVYGSRKIKPLLKDKEDKLQELLNSMALAQVPYVNFDNVAWGNAPIQTVLLDTWISNDEWDFRVLGGNVMKAPRLRGVTLLSGNDLKVSPDLNRRSLIVDMWNPVAGSERELPDNVVMLDGVFFRQERHRVDGLRALWALVRGWWEAGRPLGPGRLLGSFEDWARYAPGVVTWAGKLRGEEWDCMKEGVNQDIGDKESREYQDLARLAIAEFGWDEEKGGMRDAFEVTVVQFAGVARRHGKATHSLWPEVDVEGVLSTEGQRNGFKFEAPKNCGYEPTDFMAETNELPQELMVMKLRAASEWLSPKTRSSFGKHLEPKINDRHFKGPDGRTYHVRKKACAPPARYTVTLADVKRR